MLGQICMGKIKKQSPGKWTLIKNYELFFQAATGVLKMKVQSFQRVYVASFQVSNVPIFFFFFFLVFQK
jgi:hypothetical protein